MTLNGKSRKNIIPIFHAVILTIFTIILLLLAFNSLGWRMVHDTPLLHYAAWLMDKHEFVPYKNIFETSMPGTFAFHYFIGSLFGYGDLAFRIVDLTLLGALLFATYLFMSRFGRLPALWAAILFGILYLSKGQRISLQRDYIGIIPIAFALLTIPAQMNTNVHVGRFAIVGLLFGLSAMIKPHLGIGLPIVFWVLLSFRWSSGGRSLVDFIRCGAVTGVSFLLPLVIAIFWLAANSALRDFIDIFFNYLPMHNKLTGSHQSLSNSNYIKYMIKNTLLFGGYAPLLLSSLLGYNQVVNANEDKQIRVPLILLLLCTAAYAIYPTFAGKFWPYHYMPLAYFATISTALCVYAWPDRNTLSSLFQLRNIIPIFTLLLAITLQVSLPRKVYRVAHDLQSGSQVHAPKNGRVDEIASWLKSRLRPGDTVQPLDWADGGSIHAMLIAEATLATQFMYDYHFYHNISSDYTKKLRRRFIEQLRKAMPRFVIDIQTSKGRVSGLDTTREFPELKTFLDGYYKIAFQCDDYLIYEREIDPR